MIIIEMLKVILLVMTIIINAAANAQSDGFFTYHLECSERNNDEWGELLLLPNTHGLDYNYPANSVPISQGLSVMLLMGIVYLIKKNDG